jgi:hypothetical protein
MPALAALVARAPAAAAALRCAARAPAASAAPRAALASRRHVTHAVPTRLSAGGAPAPRRSMHVAASSQADAAAPAAGQLEVRCEHMRQRALPRPHCSHMARLRCLASRAATRVQLATLALG